MYARHAGFVERINWFDPQFFGIAPREAVSMDPQQRLLLTVTWEALEDAGRAPDRLVNSRTGVFLGIGGIDYVHSWRRNRLDAYSASGLSHRGASGPISHILGLQGPSPSIDTACSASLVAVHYACVSLRLKECDLALAGGVSLMLFPQHTIALSKSNMMAPDGRCKTFDARADGFVRGEGAGVV